MDSSSDPNPKPHNNNSHSDSKSLTSSSTSNNNTTQQGAYPSFSKLLQGVVMAANSTVSPNHLVKDVNFQAQFGISHQEALASVSAKAVESQMQQSEVEPKSEKPSNELPPSKDCEGKPSIQHKENVQKVDKKNSSCLAMVPVKPADSPPPKPVPVQLTKGRVGKLDVKRGNSFRSDERADDIPRTPNSDGYGWRKYGQKQVKNSGSSRSYYRCTFYNCIAKKKVQHLDVSGEIIAVVYKGEHNHDPPQHLTGSTRKRDPPLAVAPVNEKQIGDPHTPTSAACGKKEVEHAIVPVALDNGERNPSTPASLQEKDAGQESITTPAPIQRVMSEEPTLSAEAEQCKSSKSDECGMKEFDVIPLKKRRIKECGKSIPESVYRTFKEPKVIMHTSGDVGSSDDGYRWRKYGQKMVKGNPNPRSYYRCSSAGCPVRKHVERSTDNSTAIIVTYEGLHDHDKPILKKVQGHNSPRSPPTTEKPGPKSPPTGPKSRDVDSEPKGNSDKKKPAEAGSSDKVLESSGIEIKSC